MIVEFLLLVLIAVVVFAFVLAPIVWSGREKKTTDQPSDVSAENSVPAEPVEQIGPNFVPERQPEQKQPVRDAP